MLFSFDGRTPPIAFDIQLEDGRVVYEAVYSCQRHGGIREDPVPFAERLVCGDEQRSPLVPRADQLEQDRSFGLVLGDIGEVIEDQQVEPVEPVYRAFKRKFAARDLQFLDEV
jgi:hypothetical protein